MRQQVHEDVLTIWLEGAVDSSNAKSVEQAILDAIEETGCRRVRLDADKLSYISSAGLRVIVRLLKLCDEVTLVNASPDVYDVLDMTGMREIMDVRKRLREERLDGLRQIGAGAFGRVYRLDAERVMKVYQPSVNPLEKIERERMAARQAFIHDIPSAIPFDTVRVGEEYGIIYELIDAQTLGEAVMTEPARLEEYATRMAQLLKKLHTTHFSDGQLPDARGIFHGWVDVAERSGLYADETIGKLRQFVDEIPAGDTFVHGDYHPANIMVMSDGELLLIDMGDASMGDPIIDLAGTYHVLRVAAKRPGGAERFTGMPEDVLEQVWGVFVRAYYGVSDAAEVEAIEHHLAFMALPRGMGSTTRSKLLTEAARVQQARQLEETFLAGYHKYGAL